MRIMMANSELRPHARRRRGFVRGAARLAWNALAAFGLLTVIYLSGFELSIVSSGSMAPTLQGEGGPGSDWVLYERISYRLRAPRRWEVAQYETEDHLTIAKRVVGLPGECVAIVENQAVIDGTRATPPPALAFLHYYPEARASNSRAMPCGAGYLMLGDDSLDSYDSRYEGPVAPGAIRARAWLIVWPPRRMGFVNAG